MVNVAILGFGVVGSGVAEVLDTNERHIEGKVDDLIRLKYILDVRDFPDSPFAGKVVHDFSVIEQDPEVSIVVETIGAQKRRDGDSVQSGGVVDRQRCGGGLH